MQVKSVKFIKASVDADQSGALYVLGEVLKTYKQSIVLQGQRPYGVGCEEARRKHDAAVKELEYQLGYLLSDSLAVLRMPDAAWGWYLEVLQKHVTMVSDDLSNYPEVVKVVYQEIEAHRRVLPARGVTHSADASACIEDYGHYAHDNLDGHV
jgi:hypothetical protein